MDTQHLAGTGIGMSAGFFKAFVGVQMLGMLTWGLAIDTAILALIGGILGWIGTELMKTLKRYLTRVIHKKND